MRKTDEEKRRIRRRVNNLSARIKTRYPNLFNGVGGRYIRNVLKDFVIVKHAEKMSA